MAEGALFCAATSLVSTLASLASKKAHERAYIAKDDLEKLMCSVETIRAVLLDAEKQRDGSAAVRSWIKEVADVLYDLDDLVDEISTRSSRSIAYAYKSSAQFKAIAKGLDRAAGEIKMFSFVPSQREEQMSVVASGGSFVGSTRVIGRNQEEKDILEFLLKESSYEEKNVKVIAIVGIGGMGKTALAQLVYNNPLVVQNFEKRWWASAPNTYGDTENFRMKNCIRESVREARKYLLVIDDAWDENHTKWSERMSLLYNGCVGCRIIVTTRSLLVARAVEAVKVYKLSGLSADDSWELFKMIAFTPEEESDPRWISLGRGIVNKCSGVPLAITRIASHLSGRSMEEWESFINEDLSKIELSSDVVMSVLKLSYDRLPSGLKHCFAYCSLFPKGYVISKQKLLSLWIAQGYVISDTDEHTVEEIAEAYLNQLLSIFFLEKVEQDDAGETEHYKMHDLVHDLAQAIAGDEVAVLTERHPIPNRSARHAAFGYDILQPSEALPELPGVDRLRSCLFFKGTGSHGSSMVSSQKLAKFRCLRALDLSELGIEYVPRSVGDLIHLRYLNLSGNRFESLPDSLFKLSNLITLDISGCVRLKAWPKNMGRLIRLRHLYWGQCPGLTHMPEGFEELTHLQHLSDFKPGGDRRLFEAFSKLKLKGKLTIDFVNHHVEEDDDRWQIPATLEGLSICSYSGAAPPSWRDKMPAAIVRLEFHHCEKLRKLPALRKLRNLKTLVVNSMRELEYVEEEDAEETTSFSSFPCLENLSLVRLPELKGWSRTGKLEGCVFPRLKKLVIAECPGMELWGDVNRGVEWDSLSSLRTLEIRHMPTPESLPRCLLQRNVDLCGFLPRGLLIEGNNQISSKTGNT